MLVAVGDVHGQAELLEDLLARIRAAGLLGAARLVLVGDLIDRGPDPRGVLDRCLDLRAQHPDTVFLRGNHEQLLLDALDARDPSAPGCPERPAVRAPLAAWLACGGAATLRSYGLDARPLKWPELRAWREAIPADHLAFLRSMTMEHIAERHHFVHAGLPPDGTMDAGPGGRDPRLWIREEFLRSDSDFGGRTVVHGHTP
ncbi:MAG TPA: metallophosphoesterase, partial [Chthonomonadales bacterium]|nr:metallophosphoesterase [Chthonomonadales bacterium]